MGVVIDEPPLPADDELLASVAHDALLVRTPVTRRGLVLSRDSIQFRLEANARELRVILRERMVAHDELARVEDQLAAMGGSSASASADEGSEDGRE